MNPPGVDWSKDRYEVTHVNCAKFWQDLRNTTAHYSNSTFTIDSLKDDYQQLFVRLVLGHVHKLIHATDSRPPIPPLRLFLLGTAGTGKTRAIHTLLQNLQDELANFGLPCDFIRPAAPTGSAAFNMRFGATTIHRLIHWFAPKSFLRLLPGSPALERLQTNLANTRLVLFDEVFMVGRQFMGKIDDRLKQAKAGRPHSNASLGGLSCVCVGDPAQCEAMRDQQLYDVTPHKRTQDGETNEAARFSNVGLSVYNEFEDVIILKNVHRIRKIDGDQMTDTDQAYNERATDFMNMLHKLRDLRWTLKDYYWLVQRKRSSLRKQSSWNRLLLGHKRKIDH